MECMYEFLLIGSFQDLFSEVIILCIDLVYFVCKKNISLPPSHNIYKLRTNIQFFVFRNGY